MIAYQATLKGLSRLDVHPERIAADLGKSWEVLAGPVQTVMRKYGMEEPYEKLKAATRGRQLTAALYEEILDALALPAEARAELAALTPEDYTGAAADLAAKPLD